MICCQGRRVSRHKSRNDAAVLRIGYQLDDSTDLLGGCMMHSYQSFAVIGGDLRQAHVANQLAAQGKTVYALLLETNEALHRTLICEKTPGEILPL